jgi:membrane carboxypeptidase/penicillin-binding protein
MLCGLMSGEAIALPMAKAKQASTRRRSHVVCKRWKNEGIIAEAQKNHAGMNSAWFLVSAREVQQPNQYIFGGSCMLRTRL